MHIKFLNHSTGSGRAAVAYLLGETDSKGQIRADVRVLRGNPELVGQLIDSLDFVHRYSSAVFAFHVDDAPTDAEIQNVLDDFERVSFSGLAPTQYTWSAVLHQEADGSKHIHFITPRVELISGKSMNIAPPGWQRRFDPLRDALNYEHGWARPDDPRLARLVQPGPVGNFAGWKAGADARQQITDWLTAKISAGLVGSRDDVVSELASIGTINRQGSDYISVRLEDGAKPIRLKGAIYAEKFDGRAIREAATAVKGRPRGREEPDRNAAEAARQRLEKVIGGRSDYNRKHYPAPEPSYRVAPCADVEAFTLVDAMAPAVEHLSIDIDRRQRERLELVEGPADERADQADPNIFLRDTGRPAELQVKAKNDRTGELIARAIEAAKRAARAAIHAVERAAAAARGAYQAVVDACRAVDQITPFLIAKQNQELIAAEIAPRKPAMVPSGAQIEKYVPASVRESSAPLRAVKKDRGFSR